MTKKEIFEMIVDVVHHDSATKKDIVGADPDQYRARISENMSEDDFYYQVRSYLASFGVLSHLNFFPKKSAKVGFRLRSLEEALIVEVADESTGLIIGDEIIKIAGQTLNDFKKKHASIFVSKTPERQYMDWAYLITKVKTVRVLRAGKELDLLIGAAGKSQQKAFQACYLNPETYYIKMENFNDEASIASLYEKVFPELQKAKYAIIDVRVNHGGSDSLYFPLLDYLLPANQTYQNLTIEDDFGMEILYTPRTKNLRLAEFQDSLDDPNTSAATRQMLEEMTADLLSNQQEGYQIYKEDGDDFLSRYKGKMNAPEKVIILSDVTCGSSGDNFVLMMKAMPKVRVMGRPTMGILDYSNCCMLDFEDYQMLYPTSRSLAIDSGKGMTDVGVEPHVVIPWTRQHLVEDVDIKTALAYLEQDTEDDAND